MYTSQLEKCPSRRNSVDSARSVLEASWKLGNLLHWSRLSIHHLVEQPKRLTTECSLLPHLTFSSVIQRGLLSPASYPHEESSHTNTRIIDPPTEGQPTPRYEGEDLQFDEPSVNLISNTIIDSRFIQIVSSARESSKNNSFPILMAYNVDHTVHKSVIRNCFSNLAPLIRDFKYIFFRGKLSLLIYIDDLSRGDHLRQFAQSETRLKQLLGHGYDLFWVVDKYLAGPPRDYFAVVIRNLPPNMPKSEVLLQCSSTLNNIAWQQSGASSQPMNRVIHVEEPSLVFSQHCTILVVSSREDAEILCQQLNETEISKGFALKVHLHPLCSTKRNTNSRNVELFPLFFGKSAAERTTPPARDYSQRQEEFWKRNSISGQSTATENSSNYSQTYNSFIAVTESSPKIPSFEQISVRQFQQIQSQRYVDHSNPYQFQNNRPKAKPYKAQMKQRVNQHIYQRTNCGIPMPPNHIRSESTEFEEGECRLAPNSRFIKKTSEANYTSNSIHTDQNRNPNTRTMMVGSNLRF